MKYCPYCGADLIEGAVSFCAECGKQLPAGKVQKDNPKEKPEMTRIWDNDTSVTRGPATMKAGRWNSYGPVRCRRRVDVKTLLTNIPRK